MSERASNSRLKAILRVDDGNHPYDLVVKSVAASRDCCRKKPSVQRGLLPACQRGRAFCGGTRKGSQQGVTAAGVKPVAVEIQAAAAPKTGERYQRP